MVQVHEAFWAYREISMENSNDQLNQRLTRMLDKDVQDIFDEMIGSTLLNLFKCKLNK